MSGLEPAAQLAWTRSLSLRLSYGNPCDRSVFAAERYSESAAVMVSADEALELRFQHRGVYRSCSELLPSPETSRHACGARIARMDVAPAAVRFACRRFMRSCTVWNQSCRHAAPLQAAHAQAVGSTSAGARLPVRKALLFGSVRLDGMQQTNLQHATGKPATCNRQTCNMQQTNQQHATDKSATCNRQTCNMQQTNLQHATDKPATCKRQTCNIQQTNIQRTRGAATCHISGRYQRRCCSDTLPSRPLPLAGFIEHRRVVGGRPRSAPHRLRPRNEQRATCNMQRATSNEQRATCNEQRATCNMQRATYNVQHATSNEQHATSNMQRATSNEQRTTSCWPGFRLRVVS